MFKLKCALFFLITFSSLYAEEWKRVYLATFPRSGNHWMRYLLEEATHIATGSVYQDADILHLPVPFKWGGFCAPNGYEGDSRYPELEDIVVIKTHAPSLPFNEYDRRPFLKAVRIVRHPVDSFYSFHLFVSNYHTNPQPLNKKIIKEYISMWKEFQEYWDRQENVLTIRYEDLLAAPEYNFKLVVDHIGLDISQEDIVRAVSKYPPKGYELKHIHYFKKEYLRLIQNELRAEMIRFNYIIPKEALPRQIKSKGE